MNLYLFRRLRKSLPPNIFQQHKGQKKMKNKKICKIGLVVIFSLVFTGCSGKIDSQNSANEEMGSSQNQFKMETLSELRDDAKNFSSAYDNLDFSDTVIRIPDVEEITDLEFPISIYSQQELIQKFEENIRNYANLETDMDLTPYMNMMYWDKEENDRLVVPFNDATDEQMEQIQYLSYNDGSNSELLVFSNYMLEMGNYGIPTELTGDGGNYSDDAYGYRGYNLGTLVETYEFMDNDIPDVSFTLADGEVSLKDAVSFVEKHVKEDYYFVGSELLDYRVFEVEVRQLNDATYYYQFRLSPLYHGVVLNKDSGIEENIDEQTDPLAPEIFGDSHKISMFRSDQLGFIWSSCHSYENVEAQESHTEFISLDDACSILSGHISDKKEFTIESVELLYQTELQYESEEKRAQGYIQSVYCHPVYHFTVSNPKISGYTSIYFNVDALTGELATIIG